MLRDFDLVIFDCDGVLVDSERLTVEVEARILTGLGWPLTADDVVRRWMGRTAREMLADIEDRLGAGARAAYAEECEPVVRAAMLAELTPVPGIPEVLAHLRQHRVADCVASSGTPERMRFTLGHTGLHDHFAGRIFSAVEVEHGKPAPDLFLHAARSMGVEPGRCAVVEDSVPGVTGAVAAGMTTFGFGGGLAARDALAAAGATVFDQMTDLTS